MKHYFNLAKYFYDIVNENRNNIALKYEDMIISYDELNKLSNKLAQLLLSRDIKPYDVVGIINTKELIGYATMLACLKIGATYTNIDKENPPNRLEKIIKTCNAKILIIDKDCSTNRVIYGVARKINIPWLMPDVDRLDKFTEENLDISINITGSTPAYIMFTSGSTGIPKGVTISHDNLLSFIGWSIDRYEITSKDIFAQLSPMYFDNSVFDYYTAFFSGSCLVPIKKELTKNPLELVTLVDKMQCTIWFSVPSFIVYLQTMRVLTNKTFQFIRIFTFGGEGFPKGELKKLYDMYGKHAKLINVYGPTEGTCICTSYDISAKDFEDIYTLASLGSINPNFEYMILDKNMQKVEKGQKGELCLGGPNVALGYYNDKERSSQNFVQNPNIETHKDIIYMTGDIVYEKDNLLWFVGRIDNQIKHMGYRIELEEIESALNALSYINQSAVIYERVNTNFGKLLAFVATKMNVNESQIKRELMSHLPEYMIPNIIEVKNVLPSNANGKIDKASLSKNMQSKNEF